MEEVDKIIIASLRQIGCNLDDEACFNMHSFTPELLVHAVAICLQEIKPNAALPQSLPANMAQRFTVASLLAEACAGCGYRSDIGYQTFLYPNAVDVRRLFMFLIEQLPKESRHAAELLDVAPIGEYEALRRHVREQLQRELKSPWVPQYCRAVANRRQAGGCSSHNIKFAPQLNLNILGVQPCAKEVQQYLQQQAPSVFQQTAASNLDLVSSVLHKNALDLRKGEELMPETLPKLQLRRSTKLSSTNTSTEDAHSEQQMAEASDNETAAQLTPLEQLHEQVNALKCQSDILLQTRKRIKQQANTLNSEIEATHAQNEAVRKELKLHERTCVILEQPEQNVSKLEALIQTTQERRKTLEAQWQSYRAPMAEQLQALQTAKQAKRIQNVVELRNTIAQLETTLCERTVAHAHLSTQLKRLAIDAAPRMNYTERILEFIGNIRKQRNGIFKVLDDTRDLQKQLNSVSAQLQRQFNYTDDLLFQSAKHDVHAKKAYKLLATLHANCNEIVELVAQTGNVTKEIRDLEVQLDRERMKNIKSSLERISADIRNFEHVIKSIQAEIRKVENEITAA